MRRLTAEELDRQQRRAYPDDRLPDLGVDRNAVGETARMRSRRNLCKVCREPVMGRPPYSKTCLVHREFPAPPTRSELVDLLAEHEAVVQTLRKALDLTAVDEEAGS